MTAVESGGRFTREDFEKLPEYPSDSHFRYELLDGAIVVTPTPTKRHQRAAQNLSRMLADAAPPELEVFGLPLDTVLSTGDILEPDLLVLTRDDLDAKYVTEIPLLVVEVISPSSRRRDVGDKLTAYRDAGVPNYWVVDPIDPRLRVWRLEDGEYVEIADISGEEEWTADEPFSVTIRPVDLTR
jgi:Uma2 family endonuclease